MRIGMLATAMGMGGALWYVLDPERGAQRRAMLRDKMQALQRGDTGTVLRDLREGATGLVEQARERATGIAERARGYLDRAPASGDVVERVSATVGGALSPAGASPSGRALAGGLGGLLASAGLRRRPGIGTVLGLAGLALLIGGVANRQSVSQR